MFFVYILQSKKDGTFYTGITDDIQRRLKEHNDGRTRSTIFRRPWCLIHSEEYASRFEARKREKYWKSGSGREERNAFCK